MRIRTLLVPVIVMLLWSQKCLLTAVNAQDAVTDSIQVLIEALPNDSVRIAACLENAQTRDATVAAAYIEVGKELAENADDLHALAKLISEEAILANMDGQHILGARYFLTADSIYRELNDSALRAGSQTNVGLSFYHAGQHDKALEHYFEAYRLYDGLPQSTGFSRLLNNVAMCFKYTGKPEEAMRYYLESIALKKQLHDTVGVAHTHHNLGLLLCNLNLLEEGVLSFDTAIAIYHSLKMDDDEASSTVALGKVFMDAGQLERAEEHLNSGYRYFSQTASDSWEFMLVAGDLAKLAMEQGRWEAARRYVGEALALTDEADRLADRHDLLRRRAQISYELGRPAAAYLDLNEAAVLNDSLNSRERLALIEEMQTKFSVREKEKDLELVQIALKNERRISVIYRRGFIAVIIAMVLIGALGLFLNRSRKALKSNKKMLEVALHEKNLLLKEIHHRVKNNLQIISSLLGIQSMQSDDPKVGSAMHEGQSRVRSMALIHQSLYQNESFVAVEARDYVSSLVDNLLRGYRIDPERIAVETEVDPIRISVDTMIPLGLILNELVTNALKYAFPENRSGLIHISLKANGSNLMLKVSDNGIGVDPEALRQSTSMGFTLVSDFCAKLKADLDVLNESGTTIQIHVPDAALSVI